MSKKRRFSLITNLWEKFFPVKEVKTKKIFLIITGIALVGLIFSVFTFSSLEPSGASNFFMKPKEVKKMMATLIPEEKADFSKDGNLHLHNKGEETEMWEFLYAEPGNPAVIAYLNFNNRSKCDYGQGEQICSEKHFENGMRVHIEGKKSDDNLTVLKLKILE